MRRALLLASVALAMVCRAEEETGISLQKKAFAAKDEQDRLDKLLAP